MDPLSPFLLLTMWVSALAGASAPPPADGQAFPPVEDLLGSYVRSIESGEPIHLPALDLDLARLALSRKVPELLAADGAATGERRRRLVTAFALELAAAGSSRDSEAAARLVEWACEQVRSKSPPTDFDRAWQRAALDVLEGGIHARALLQHVNHAQPRFKEDARLVLARAILEEQSIAPAEVRDGPTPRVNAAKPPVLRAQAEAERTRMAERAIAAFRAASKEPRVSAEAKLRLGHVQLGIRRYADALTAWTDLERQTDDKALIYLVNLFRGLAFEGLNQPEDAKASYLAAIKTSPGAHSATMRLAALAFRYGRGDVPARLLDTLLRDSDPRKDPWWSYYAADWRFWYTDIERVRALLR